MALMDVIAGMTELPAEERLEREAKRVAALDEIGASLDALKDKAVVWRGQFEAEWALDWEQYNHASRSPATAKRQGSEPRYEEAAFRQTSDNITRSKVIITAARLGDMLFPTNDANWSMEPTPDPSIPEERIPPPPAQQDEQGNPVQAQPYTPEQLVQVKQQVAKKACDGMKRKVKDQLGESSYAEHGRATIFDGCLYGTGVLFGPTLKNKKRHTYRGNGYQAQMVEAAKPSVEYVDLMSFYPQPCRSIEECEHAFRLRVMTASALRRLTKQPGFDSRQIARLLKMEPMHGALVGTALAQGSLRPGAQDVVLTDRYSVWQYRGPMPKEAFAGFVLGLVLQGEVPPDSAEAVLAEMENDPLHEIDCEVWVCQGVVIKMALSTLEPGETGYHVFCYEDNPASIFGRGVAYLCRDDQHAVNQLWHASMLNSMMSAGPQIGVRKGSLHAQPGEGRSSTLFADRPRVWALNDDVQDIRHVLSVFNIPNNVDAIMGMYERAKANADEHTMTPLIAQGEPTSAVPTSSGMAMLMNAANVVMRRLAKEWDDSITLPLIQSFYDWNMTYSEDESIKGDYCVIPRGASHLLIKDVQAQHIQFATQLFSTNPVLAPYMKAGPFARRNIEMLDCAPDDLLYTDEEVAQIQAQQAEQPDPELVKAQAAQATAEAQVQRAQTDAAAAADKMEYQREERRLSHLERMADIQARERIQGMQLRLGQLQLAQQLAEMEKDERLQMQKLIADLEKGAGNLDLQQYRIDTDAALNAERIAQEDDHFRREIEVEKKTDVKVQ